MLQLALHDAWARKRRLAGSGLAVVLGVAFLFATLAVGDTLRAGFDTLFAQANAGIDVTVRSTSVLGTDDDQERDTIDGSLATTLAGIDGVSEVLPAIEGRAQIVAADGSDLGGDGPPTEAGNWIDHPTVNPFTIAEGRAPVAVPQGTPVEVVIDRRSATTGGLAVGDRTTVKTPANVDVVVVGIAVFGELDSLGPSTYVAFELETARRLLLAPGAGPDAVSSFTVVADTGVDESVVRDAVASVVPTDLEALTGAELTAEQVAAVESDFLGFVRVFLLAFAGVAVLVAAFSIHNTFSILVAQRTRESALLRSLGATRRQIVGSNVAEALIVGAGASLVGLLVGWGLTLGLLELVASFGVDLPGTTVLSLTSVVIAAAVGVLVTVVASAAPAVRASRVAPLEALRAAAIDRSGVSVVRAIAGLAMLAAGLWLSLDRPADAGDALGRAGLGAVLAVVAAVVLGPVVAGPTIAVLGAPVRWFRGETGRLAVGNARRNPRRTAGTASALLVGTAVVSLFTVIGASISGSIERAVNLSFGGDLVVVLDSFSGAAIDPELTPALEALDEVAMTAALTTLPALVDGTDTLAMAVDPARLDALYDLGAVAGSMPDMQPGELAVSEREAERRGWTLGTPIAVSFADGATLDTTVAVIYAQRDMAGDVLVHVDDVADRRTARGDVAVMIDLADGVSLDAGAAAVDAAAGPFGAPPVQTRDEYTDSIAGEIQSLLGVVYGLLGLAVVIALMGLANTLSLSVHERTRELGLLRAVGQTRRQLRATVRWESLLIAVFGTLAGVGLGTFLGWSLVRAVAFQEGFGTFTAPVTTLIAIVLGAAVAGTLAAALPARRAARLDVLAALSTDG